MVVVVVVVVGGCGGARVVASGASPGPCHDRRRQSLIASMSAFISAGDHSAEQQLASMRPRAGIPAAMHLNWILHFYAP